MKVNTDAAFDASSCTGSSGVVIRDHAGRVLSGVARWFEHVLTAEALVAKEGLELAVENGYDRVILEVDCSSLKSLLDDQNGMRSSIGGLWFHITELGRSFFIYFKVVWVCRDANSVALFWLDYIPEWLLGLAAADYTPVID